MDETGPAAGLRVLAEFAVLPAATGNTSLTGETIRRPTDARASGGHRITEVSLSQRLVARNQAYRLRLGAGIERVAILARYGDRGTSPDSLDR